MLQMEVLTKVSGGAVDSFPHGTFLRTLAAVLVERDMGNPRLSRYVQLGSGELGVNEVMRLGLMQF